MSVDYRASYGIGYEVDQSEELTEEDLQEGLEEYIEGFCGEDFYVFETGSAYSGEIDGTYLAIKDPFKDGLDLTAAKEKIDGEIKRLKLEPLGEFGTIGGLYVY